MTKEGEKGSYSVVANQAGSRDEKKMIPYQILISFLHHEKSQVRH